MFLIIITFIAFLFYKSALSYYFISDDFLGFIKINNPLDLFKIDPFNNHYSPVIKTVSVIFTKIFAYNPVPYHFYTIAVHLINIYLVYSLSKLFINNKLKNVLAALIFAFFFADYEVVFWYGGSNNSLLVTFYVLSLMFLIRFISQQVIPAKAGIHSKYPIFFQIFFVFAFFTHEYAISLIPVGMVYWWLFFGNKNGKEFIKIFAVPLLAIISITLLKIFIVQIPLTVRTFSIFKFAAFSMRSVIYLFVGNPYVVDKIPNYLIPVIFLGVSIILFKLTKNKRTLFLLIWTGLTIFVYSATSAPQARYYYLSYVPVIIYILSLTHVSFPRRRESRLDPRPSPRMTNSFISIFYLLFILTSGILFLQNQKYYWKLNSKITKNVISDLKKYTPQLQKAENIYFINLPDSSNDSVWKAYVFRAGFEKLLNNFVNIYPKKIVYLTSFEPTSHTMEVPFITPEKLPELKQNNIVFVYKENLESIVLLK